MDDFAVVRVSCDLQKKHSCTFPWAKMLQPKAWIPSQYCFNELCMVEIGFLSKGRVSGPEKVVLGWTR